MVTVMLILASMEEPVLLLKTLIDATVKTVTKVFTVKVCNNLLFEKSHIGENV